MMKSSEVILFKLLRIALGNGNPVSLPNVVDWREIIDLSFRQGVPAIVADGIERVITENTPELSALSTFDNHEIEDVKYSLFTSVINQEEEYEKRESLIGRISKSIGLDFKVLKGISFSRYYPIPEHRYGSDVDFITTDYVKANDYFESKGIAVDRSIKIHSQFTIRGILFENHRYLTEESKELNECLLKLLKNSDNTVYPSDEFNALFCLIHAKKHFLIEDGITLRHICDWAMIRSRCVVSDTKLAKFGLQKFERPFTELAQLLMGEIDEDGLSREARLMLENVFKNWEYNTENPDGVHRIRTLNERRWKQFRDIVGNNWKFKMYNDVSMPRYIVTSIWRHFVGTR